MAEPRCGLVHMPSGRALAKLERGDCAASLSDFALADATRRKLRHSAYEFKLQVAQAAEGDEPQLLWIRIGVHPQRCLCVGSDGAVRLEKWLSPSAQEPQWRIHFLEAQEPTEEGTSFPAMCLLQNAKTGQFLSVSGGSLALQSHGDIWGIVRLRGAATPGKVLRRSAIVGGGGVALASAGAVGVTGAIAVRAVVKGCTAATAAGSAVTAAATAAAGLSVTKAAAAVVAIPGAVAAAVAAGTAAVTAVSTVGATVSYVAVGAGCGTAIGTAGAVAAATAKLVDSAREPGLYVHGYPFVPTPLMRGLSKLSVQSEEGTLKRLPSEIYDDNDSD